VLSACAIKQLAYIAQGLLDEFFGVGIGVVLVVGIRRSRSD
jgi:hypothetical protein